MGRSGLFTPGVVATSRRGFVRGGSVARRMDLEFFGPFAHLPGRLEWCRIRSPTHGVFDTCIVIDRTTSDPVTVYVDSDQGERFMAERFPGCTAIRVPAGAMTLQESDGGHRLHCRLAAKSGPLRNADMTFKATPGVPRQVAYGGEGKPVWGSAYTCRGVDLELDAAVRGELVWATGPEDVAGTPGILTLGSMGELTLL